MTTNGKLRLGGWTRIGIIVSVPWVLDAVPFTRIDAVLDADSWSNRIYNVCVVGLQHQTPIFYEGPSWQPLDEREIEQVCKEEAQQAYQTSMQDSMRDRSGGVVIIGLPTIAFGPLLIFWLIAWVIRATYRRVRRGFNVPASPLITP
jgi:hypothetical protein